MDQLAEKYYSQTPYGYAGNNPILFVDYDGMDYGLHFDHENKTVTVRATYYANSKSIKSADRATSFWNKQSGNFSYTVGEGEDAVSYTVNFELTAVEAENPLHAKGIDSSGEANVYSVVGNKDPRLAEDATGETSSGNRIMVKKAYRHSGTGAHEIGHTLGMIHDTEGIMTASASDPNRSNTVTANNIQEMMLFPIRGEVNTTINRNGFVVKAGVGTVKNSLNMSHPIMSDSFGLQRAYDMVGVSRKRTYRERRQR